MEYEKTDNEKQKKYRIQKQWAFKNKKFKL